MRVEILRARLYRGEALEAGRITDMDDYTAGIFIGKGWAKKAAEAAPITTKVADAIIPTGLKRRRALR